ncbi:MAG: nitrilase-related carbon-nitrogen hydrolase, partial [Acidimicrobiales bacterium]
MSGNLATLAAVQMTAGSDVEANVTTALELVERAVDLGATYVQVPEYVTYYGPTRGFAAAAETIPGPTTGRVGPVGGGTGGGGGEGRVGGTTPRP